MRHATALLALVALAGCAQKAPPAPVEAAVVVEPAPFVVVEEVVEIDPVVTQVHENFSRLYFAFDSAEINPDSMDVLEQNAKILQEHPDVRVQIEGHADERGTIDYNLALAERRARAVERALTSMGVSEGQLGVVSFGEERPLRTGESPSAFSVNRRAEFRVTRDADGMVDGSLDQPVPAHGLISPEDEL
ncbi:MAG: OmpA family protein [Alphaproteobacteria bacterium]|nr:OmpA family protein [Alphaproteobacteria bacterium]MCB9692590.1 OmpA family protein [Alphaproteobacteria bacterium]